MIRITKDKKTKQQHIELTRGDTAYLDFEIIDDNGNEFLLGENDIVKCQVRENVADDSPLLFEGVMEYADGKASMHIRPEDTEGKEVKTYVYDVEVEMENGDVFTFIPVSNFTLTDESTRKDG